MTSVGETSETAAQLFARLSVRPTLNTIGGKLFTHNIKQNHCIEIIGEEGTGKTEVVLHMIINTIAPKTWKGIHIGGCDSVAVLVDTDYKFPTVRFVSLIEQRLLTSTTTTVADTNGSDTIESEEFVKSCLLKFYKINCHSAHQLLATFRSLNTFFCENPETVLLVIDNISTYHWTEKLGSCRDHLKSLSTILRDFIEQNLLNVVLVRNMLGAKVEHGSNKSLQQTVVSARYRSQRTDTHKGSVFSLCRMTSGNHVVKFMISDTGIQFT